MSSLPFIRLPARPADAHKGSFGRVMLIGGSRGMSGSIAMSSVAALRTGAGLVTAAIPDRCLEAVAAFHPGVMTVPLSDQSDGSFATDAVTEVMSLARNFSAIGCGPGMTTGAGATRIVERMMCLRQTPRVLDADALNVLANMPDSLANEDMGPLVLTPHPGELQRLVGVAASDRSAQIQAAHKLAGQIGAVIVVKGGPSVIVDGDKSWTNTSGNPGMATAGSGDVLTGVITSLLGQDMSPWDAACLGTWVHGKAGDLASESYGQAGMTAVEILDAIAPAIRLVSQTS
ncbi:MAG: NAD(P)H-hydrate dehydratase [Rubripirellula sp.]